jgi:selenocysteine lyase/cysteine desulfurase
MPNASPLPPLPPAFDVSAEFPIVNEWTFLNHAAVAPLSARAAAALEQYAREASRHAYLAGQWYVHADAARARAAKLLNATPEEIAFVKNTSEGLAFVANGLDWRRGDEVVSTAVEYPANVYPWMDLARLGVKHVMVPERNGRIEPDEFLAAIGPRTRLVALSHVQYA